MTHLAPIPQREPRFARHSRISVVGRISLATALVTSFAVAALVSAPSAHASVNVVTTVPDLAAIARNVGGAHVGVQSLSLPTQDPHFVDAKPSLTLKVNKADLLIAVGAELEVGWLPSLQRGARNAKVQRGGAGFLECSSAVEMLGVASGPVDRSMGDIHPSGNPHYLYDPRAALACASAIADKLIALDAANADSYRANLKAFRTRMDEKRAAWEKRLAPYRGQQVISYHQSWAYLYHWLGLEEVATLEPKPGIAPSPRHLAKVIGVGRKHRVKVLIQEMYYPSKSGALVAKKIGARVVRIPGGTDFRAGETYLQHMEDVVSMLEHGFNK